MNVRILFLLLVCKATHCDKVAEPRTLVVLTIDDKCKNIKCSAQEDPTCVKVKHLKDIKKVFHVIALNKCELQFMKCHKDYEASIVAMKLCEHENIMKINKTQNGTMTRRGRVKRSIFRRETTARVHDVFDSTSSEAGGGFKVIPDHVYDEKSNWALKNRYSQEEYSGHKIHKDDIYDDKNTLSLSISPKQEDEKKSNKKKVLSQRPHSDEKKTMKKEVLSQRPHSGGEKTIKKKGRFLVIPSDAEKAYGKKGRFLVIPSDAQKANGKKGRFLVIPSDTEKAYGKKVLSQRPHSGGEKTIKKKDRFLVMPSDAEKAYGKKGRFLVIPSDAQKANGKKGRFLVIPSDTEKAYGEKDLSQRPHSAGEKTVKKDGKPNPKGLIYIMHNHEEKNILSGPKLHGDDSKETEEESGVIKLAGSIEGSEKSSGESFIEEIAPDVFQLFSEEAIAERLSNADDSVPENNDECPESCPARSDMICVKCPHGIYKTFQSNCHLRQYCCRNGGESRRAYRRTEMTEKEKNKQINMSASRASEDRQQKDLCKDMELVSRYPCILSAPFIDGAGVTSHGRVYNQNDNAVILGYFKCKSLGILGKSDPRCPF